MIQSEQTNRKIITDDFNTVEIHAITDRKQVLSSGETFIKKKNKTFALILVNVNHISNTSNVKEEIIIRHDLIPTGSLLLWSDGYHWLFSY